MSKYYQGFTLVELSIVLVILGLLVGGVLTGQSLIRAAELRSVSSDMENYTTALYAFQDKYFAVPGDMPNATQFWTSAGGTGSDPTCYMAQANGSAATCNGSGEGQIQHFASCCNYGERYMAWKHLTNAGLIKGNYTGKTGGANSTNVPTIGINVPTSKAGSKGYWGLAYQSWNASYWFPSTTMSVNTLGLYGSVLTPEDAWNIDMKMDDGSPVYGSVISVIRSFAAGCVTSDLDTATYDVAAVQSQICPLFKKLR